MNTQILKDRAVNSFMDWVDGLSPRAIIWGMIGFALLVDAIVLRILWVIW